MNTNQRRRIERTIIFDAAEADLQSDQTIRTKCPFCGAKHELSFTITRSDLGLLYNCYRVKCGAKGFIYSIPGTTELEKEHNKKKKFVARPYERPLESIPEEIYEWLQETYELTPEELGRNRIRYSAEHNRLYMPVFDEHDREFGGITKALDRGTNFPKTINYFVEQTSGLHYVRGTSERGGPIVVVEDILSGIKTSRYCQSVALLGTTINPEKIMELRKYTDSIILMLDPDAFDKALKYKRKYSLYFRNFFVVLLSEDPKDTKQEELERIIIGYLNGAEASSSGTAK